MSTIDSARHSAIDVSSIHAPAGSPKGPPPTMSAIGANVPGRWNSSVVPTASPTANPTSAPTARSSVLVIPPPLSACPRRYDVDVTRPAVVV